MTVARNPLQGRASTSDKVPALAPDQCAVGHSLADVEDSGTVEGVNRGYRSPLKSESCDEA
jgi:hypothetical protein